MASVRSLETSTTTHGRTLDQRVVIGGIAQYLDVRVVVECLIGLQSLVRADRPAAAPARRG